MKPLHLVPPALALLAAGIWLGLQHQSLSNVESRNTTLRQRIEAARHAGPGDDEKGSSAGGKSSKQSVKKIDWKDMAMRQKEMSRGESMPDMRAMIEMQRALLGMTAEELAAELDVIAALDIPADAKMGLEGMLVGMLAQKDPKLVMERFGDRIDDERSGMSWQVANAFQQWSQKDPAEALAWLDKQIADGKLESKSLNGANGTRQRMEAAAINALLATNPAAAAERLSRIPEDQRAAVFQSGMFYNLKPGSEKATADLIRSQVPEAQRNDTLASSCSMMVHQGGYERVGKFMSEIDASPGEREAIASQAVRSKIMNTQDGGKLEGAIEEARTWAQQQAPEAVNRITGQALGQSNDFAQASQLALKNQEESGNDEVLIAFIEQGASYRNPDAALKLVDKVSDPAKQEELRKKLKQMGVGGGGGGGPAGVLSEPAVVVPTE